MRRRKRNIENLIDEKDKLLDNILNITVENIDIRAKLENKIEKEIKNLEKTISTKNKKIELLKIQLHHKQNFSIDNDPLNKL